MAELKRKEEELTTAELASYGIPRKAARRTQAGERPRAGNLRIVRLQSQSPCPCFLNRRWEISDRSGARYRLVSWTNRAGRSKKQTSW